MIGVKMGKRVTGFFVQARAGRALRQIVLLIGLLSLALPLPGLALAKSPDVFPEILPLPDGFQPEGIVIGKRLNFYVGSLADGSIYRGSLLTGVGEVLVAPEAGRTIVGLAYDRRSDYFYAAGGRAGTGYVFDAESGEKVAEFQFTTEASFINDVVVTRNAAYFTDSFRPFLYKVPLSRNGDLPDPAQVVEIPLGGEYTFVPGAFNANGIDAPFHGKWLILVHSSRGELYRVNPDTGHADLIDLGGDSVPNGDGILLKGKTLYVVQNRLNQIAVIKLDRRANSGRVVDILTSPNFRVPTTIDSFGEALYAVNARFGTPPTPDTEYEVVRVLVHSE